MTDQQTPPARLPYTPPTLKTFGSLTQVTNVVGTMGKTDGGAMKTTNRTR